MRWKRDTSHDEEFLHLLDDRHLLVSELVRTVKEEGITTENKEDFHFYQEKLLEIDNHLDELSVFDVSRLVGL